MKNLLAFVVMLFLVSFSAQAQEKAVVSQDSIVFEKMVHDYGTIAQNSDGNTEFKFTNKGKGPVFLNDVKASCGCTVPEWTREPIAPGKTGSIKVRYNTAIAGAFSKSITVNSNAANSQVMLIIKGNVTPPAAPPVQ